MAAVMDALAGVTLSGVPTTSRYGWPQESVVPPAWVVGYPEDIDYDLTEGAAGYVTATFPCFYIVGNVVTKAARDKLALVISGAAGVKIAIEGTAVLSGGGTPVAQTTRVTNCRPQTITVGAVNLLAARFDVEVIG